MVKKYRYTATKQDIVKYFGNVLTKEKLHKYFFHNRDYNPKETKAHMLNELKQFNIDTLRDLADNLSASQKFNPKKKLPFKQTLPSQNTLKKKTKPQLLQIAKGYYDPSDYKKQKLEQKNKDQLIQFFSTF